MLICTFHVVDMERSLLAKRIKLVMEARAHMESIRHKLGDGCREWHEQRQAAGLQGQDLCVTSYCSWGHVTEEHHCHFLFGEVSIEKCIGLDFFFKTKTSIISVKSHTLIEWRGIIEKSIKMTLSAFQMTIVIFYY